MQGLKRSISRFRDALSLITKHKINPAKAADNGRSIYDFRSKKRAYYIESFRSSYRDLKDKLKAAIASSPVEKKETASALSALLKELDEAYGSNDIEGITCLILKLDELAQSLEEDTGQIKEAFKIDMTKVPIEIRAELSADLKELSRCFSSGCYRSSVILCGRLLEASLHRHYFDRTGHDILEKSPGIGLGSLIAKMREKNIMVDPALTNQIHLINQVRIFSVHKKKEPFCPSMQQAHAIILYTIDTVSRLF